MSVYEARPFSAWVSGNPYVGRGIIVGKSPKENRAVIAYFIMGRSDNSRNRVFVPDGEDVMIHPFDASRVKDPSLIIYAPVRTLPGRLIVTNGDQTDTVRDFILRGGSFEQALDTRCFEPDAPNFTPRISAMISFDGGDFSYKMNILKSADAQGSDCNRFTFGYAALPGVGHFLHTYQGDGQPLPTFQGEPQRVEIPGDMDAFADEIWRSLDDDNKIALYVRYTDASTGAYQERLINKYR